MTPVCRPRRLLDEAAPSLRHVRVPESGPLSNAEMLADWASEEGFDLGDTRLPEKKASALTKGTKSSDYQRVSGSKDEGNRIALTVEETARRLGIGRSHMYKLLARRDIQAIRLGRSRRIPVLELERFVSEALDEERVATQPSGMPEPRQA